MKTKTTPKPVEDMVLGYVGLGQDPADDIKPFDKIFKHAQNLTNVSTFDLVDAVVIWGGTDIYPNMYHQKAHPKSQALHLARPSARDVIEWHIMREAYKRGIMIIGVCRGAQMLCVFAGGSLYQDVSGHQNSHQVQTEDGYVHSPQSSHHQMMNLDGTQYELLAWPYRSEQGNVKTQISNFYEREKYLNEPGLHLESKKEPELVWFPRVRGMACQPHPEWGDYESSFNVYLMNQISERIK